MVAPAFTAPDLRGRVALVTGGGSGIGRAFSLALARHGATVWLTGRRTEPLAQTVEQLAVPGRAFCGDVNDPRHAAAVADALRAEHGKLDVLVNNAAVLGPRATLADTSPEAFDAVMRTNVSGLYRMTHALHALLVAAAPGTVIVNMSSGVGRTGRAQWGAYAASKFAVEGLTQVWADEFRGQGVSVCALNPGGTRTAMRSEAKPDEDPMTLPTPDDVVPSLMYLLSEQAEAMGLSGVSIDARDWM